MPNIAHNVIILIDLSHEFPQNYVPVDLWDYVVGVLTQWFFFIILSFYLIIQIFMFPYRCVVKRYTFLPILF
jgi:hypothetical protein